MTEGMRQAADRLASGVGNMGTAFSSRAPSEAGYRGGSGYGSAAVRALRAAPGAIAKPLSEGQTNEVLVVADCADKYPSRQSFARANNECTHGPMTSLESHNGDSARGPALWLFRIKAHCHDALFLVEGTMSPA